MLDESHFKTMRSRLRIGAFAEKLQEMCEDMSYDRYSFEEKMVMLVEAEVLSRDNKLIASNHKKPGSPTQTPVSKTSSTCPAALLTKIVWSGWPYAALSKRLTT